MPHHDFNQLITPHIPFVSLLVKRYSANPSLHCDHAQECLITLWKTLPTYNPALGKIKPWIAAVCRNRVRDLYRTLNSRKRRLTRFPNLDFDSRVTPACLPAEPACLPRVSDELQLSIRGTTLRVIAELQGIPLPTVKSRLCRERLRLKENSDVS